MLIKAYTNKPSSSAFFRPMRAANSANIIVDGKPSGHNRRGKGRIGPVVKAPRADDLPVKRNRHYFFPGVSATPCSRLQYLARTKQ